MSSLSLRSQDKGFIFIFVHGGYVLNEFDLNLFMKHGHSPLWGKCSKHYKGKSFKGFTRQDALEPGQAPSELS